MGRWCHGLLAVAALAAGCASAAPGDTVQQQSNGDSDLGSSAYDFAGGVVVGMCVDGGSCTTNNPGDCAMGHAVCSGDVQSCVPDATTQRCYDGPAGTIGKGVCKAGSQTCIGALGSCDGEVVPAAVENCFNDLDDDCDGVVNNGCPTAVATGTPRPLTPRGSTSGGAAFSLRCPAGQFVSKTIVYGDSTDSYIAGLDVYCATPTLVRGATAYTITETPNATPLMQHAANITTSANATFDCGTAAFAPAWFTPGEDESTGIDELGTSCASGALTLSATNQLTFTMTKGANMGAAGYNLGTAFEDDCNANEVLIGYDGRSGNWFDGITAVCAPLTITYK